jgi:site-specific DNA recombinase
LLVVKLDRLTRSVVHLGQLVEDHFAPGKWALLSVGEQIDTRSAAGRLVLNVLASVSQWEREAIGERGPRPRCSTRRVWANTRAETSPTGTAWALTGSAWWRTPEEQRVLSTARTLRGAGLSLRSVARELNGEGFRSRTGKQFAHVQIARMLG